MKRIGSLCSMLLIGALLGVMSLDAAAQTVKIKREAMSPGRRSSGPPNYTQPPGPYYISAGLRVVGKGMMVYLSAETTGTVTSFNWSIVAKPSGSTAVIDTPSNKFVRFIADLAGQYIVKVTANGTIDAYDTLFASTYVGVGPTPPSCGGISVCHADKKAEWEHTLHASIFTRGITGQLETDITGRGRYGPQCIRCHTTGWESATNNGNFGYIARQTNWDSTWWQGLPFSGGYYWITYRDSTLWRNLPSALVPVANIGCESCHGPGGNHFGDRTKTDYTWDAGVCQQCHDAPRKHFLGSYWAASRHATFPEGGHTNRTSCFPCHSGPAFAKWIGNKANPGWDANKDGNKNISCQACHDPHNDQNPNQLRAVAFDSLKNGWRPPTGIGGKGQLCMNCHQARYVQRVKPNNPPYYGFTSRFSPHYSAQTDMFFGRNSYEFGDARLAGLNTHTGLADGCVTCHMPKRVNGPSLHSDHEVSMIDTIGGPHDQVTACVSCHGPITSFDGIIAPYDFDRDGTIEGVQSEVRGMLEVLKSRLPLGADGEPIGGGVVTAADSALIRDRLDLVAGIYTYYFVKNDGSYGVHNTKYTVAILQKALGWYPTDVQLADDRIPKEFALKQNYPNPFNPMTTIAFSLPKQETVTLQVFDMLGRLVATLVDGKELIPGNYEITWDGKDRNGVQSATGVYLYRLQTNSFSAVKKMVMVK